MFISGRGLKNLETLGKSDPMCIVTEHQKKTDTWEVVAQTGVKKNDLQPDWEPVPMKFFFEKK